MTIPVPPLPLSQPLKCFDAVAVEAERDGKGRFRASIGNDAINDLVKDVALRATDGDLDAADRVTTRAWDEAREEIEAPGPLTASAVTKALGLGWRDCVHVALLPPAERAVAQAARRTGEVRDVTDELIRRALCAVAYRLKESPTQDAYDRVSAEIDAERAKRFGEGFGLPSSRTIRARYASWEAACLEAGLDAPVLPEAARPAEPFELYLDCVREMGCAPTCKWFIAWCRIRKRQLVTERFSLTVGKARAAWEGSGEAWPSACPRKLALPAADPDAVGDRRRRDYWTDERVLDALRRYIAVADAEGARINQRHYRLLARDRKELNLPAASVLTRRGALADLMRLARAGATRIS